jgi:hypothetical protein
MKLVKKEKSIKIAASKAGIDKKTEKKYKRADRLPCQLAKEHNGGRESVHLRMYGMRQSSI